MKHPDRRAWLGMGTDLADEFDLPYTLATIAAVLLDDTRTPGRQARREAPIEIID